MDKVLRSYLMMPALTMARTAAFMPALSPPDVRIAIFILDVEVCRDIAGKDGQEEKIYVWREDVALCGVQGFVCPETT